MRGMSTGAARRGLLPVLVFLFCAFPVLFTSALLTPMGQSPDEPAHITRAAGLLHGGILLLRKNGSDPGSIVPRQYVGVKIDSGLDRAAWGVTTPFAGHSIVTSEDLAALHHIAWQHHRDFFEIPNTATYFPLAYIPGAIGLGLGKLVGLSPVNAIMLGRFAIAAVYLLIGAAALALADFGRPVLLAVLLLPMSLILGSTFDQDGLLIALSCLACAGLTRETGFGRAVAFAAFVIVLLAKPPYLPVLAIFALPLAWPGFWRRALEVILASVPVIIWALIVVLLVSVPFKKPPYHPGILFTGPPGTMFDQTEAAINLHILLADKVRFITLPLHSLHLFWMLFLQEMVASLGPLVQDFPHWFYASWWAAILLALAGTPFVRRAIIRTLPVTLLNNAVVLALLAFTVWLVVLTFYFSWSNVGLDYIDGVQGRYVLLLVPFLPLALPALGEWLPEAVPMLPIALLGLYDIGYIPWKLTQFYYVH